MSFTDTMSTEHYNTHLHVYISLHVYFIDYVHMKIQGSLVDGKIDSYEMCLRAFLVDEFLETNRIGRILIPESEKTT